MRMSRGGEESAEKESSRTRNTLKATLMLTERAREGRKRGEAALYQSGQKRCWTEQGPQVKGGGWIRDWQTNGYETDDSYRLDCSQIEYLIDIRLTSHKIVFCNVAGYFTTLFLITLTPSIICTCT